MENAKIGEIYKVKGTDGSAVYVEVEEAPEWAKPKLDEIYICTRSPYSSGFCQIESAGVIKKSELREMERKHRKGIPTHV